MIINNTILQLWLSWMISNYWNNIIKIIFFKNIYTSWDNDCLMLNEPLFL